MHLDVYRSSKNTCLFMFWQSLCQAMECRFKITFPVDYALVAMSNIGEGKAAFSVRLILTTCSMSAERTWVKNEYSKKRQNCYKTRYNSNLFFLKLLLYLVKIRGSGTESPRLPQS